MIEQQSAGVIIFHTKGTQIEYLLLHYLSGHWDFPKGKLEPGESLIAAAMREIAEETGLTISLFDGFQADLSYVFKERNQRIKKTVTFFVGQADSQAVVLSDEHRAYRWLDYEQACRQLTYANAREILIQANDFIINATSSNSY